MFRPRLERLEDRTVPAQFDPVGSTLYETNFDTAHHTVAIFNDGQGGVTGVIDAGLPQQFSGINTIEAINFGNVDLLYQLTQQRTQDETLVFERIGHGNITIDDHLGTAAGKLFLTDVQFMNAGRTLIESGPVASYELVNEYAFASAGPIVMTRSGTVANGGLAYDSCFNVFGGNSVSMSFSGRVDGTLQESYFGASSPGVPVSLALTIDAGSTGTVYAVAYGATSGPQVLSLTVSGPTTDVYLWTSAANLANITTSPDVEVLTY